MIAQLTLVPLRPGALRIELESVKLVTRDLQTLDVSLRGLEVQVGDQAIAPADVDQPASGVAPSPPATGASPAMGVPIWMLVLVALGVIIIPLAGAWFVFIREAKRHPKADNRH